MNSKEKEHIKALDKVQSLLDELCHDMWAIHAHQSVKLLEAWDGEDIPSLILLHPLVATLGFAFSIAHQETRITKSVLLSYLETVLDKAQKTTKKKSKEQKND